MLEFGVQDTETDMVSKTEFFLVVAACLVCAGSAGADEPIPIATLEREKPVHFQDEVLPILKAKCLACHNRGAAKGDVILETPDSIRAGIDGEPIVVPGNGEESLLLKVSAHLEEPFMPPGKNKVGATPLTSEELGLLKLWIDEGAEGEVVEAVINAEWHSLPPHLVSIYAVSITEDGTFAACGRSNQIFIYNVATGETVTRLTDPALLDGKPYKKPGVAHLDQVQSLAFDPEGMLLASGGYRTVKLWRRSTPTALSTLQIAPAGDEPKSDGKGIVSLALSPDGKLLAIGLSDGRIRLQPQDAVDPSPTADSVPLKEIDGHAAAITGLEFSSDGAHLTSSSVDGSLRTRKLPGGEVERDVKTDVPIRSLTILDDGRIVAGLNDGRLGVWTMATDAAPKYLAAHEKAVTALAAIPGTPEVLTGSEGGVLRRWNVDADKPAQEMKPGSPITVVAVRPDGQRYASAGNDNLVRLWNAADATQLAELKGDVRTNLVATQKERWARLFTRRRDAAKGAFEGAEKDVKAKEDALKKAQDELPNAEKALAEKKADPEKKDEEIAKLEEAVTAAKKKITDGTAALDTSKKNVVTTREKLTAAEESIGAPQAAFDAAKGAAEAEEQPVRALAFSRDNLRLSSSGDDGSIRTWSAETGAPSSIADLNEEVAQALLFSPNGTLHSGTTASRLATWNLSPPWQLVRTIGNVDDPSTLVDRVPALNFSRDGKLLASGSGEPSRGGELKVWNVEDGQLVWENPEAHSDTIFGVEFSVNGEHLATCGADKFVKVFKVDDGSLVRSLEGHVHHVLSVSWRYDSESLTSAGADNVIKVWDAKTGAQRRTIGGYTKEVSSVRFVGDTADVLSCSGDKAVRFHNVDNGKVVRNFEGSTDYVFAVAVTPDGKLATAGGFDGVLRIWNGADGKIHRSFDPPK